MLWYIKPPRTVEDLGMLPVIFSDQDTRRLSAQADANYADSGGWRPQPGWTFDQKTITAQYPGDEPVQAWAFVDINGEKLIVFPHDYVMILQRDGRFEMCRMD